VTTRQFELKMTAEAVAVRGCSGESHALGECPYALVQDAVGDINDDNSKDDDEANIVRGENVT
jgi:hypothetical protein